MPAPPALDAIFYGGLFKQKEFTNVACELRVLAAVMGNKDAMAAAAGYLLDDDLTDAEVRRAWHELLAGFKAAGGAIAEISDTTPWARDLRQLRWASVKRQAEALAWELARLAAVASPNEIVQVCVRALAEFQALGKSIRESGLIGDRNGT